MKENRGSCFSQERKSAGMCANCERLNKELSNTHPERRVSNASVDEAIYGALAWLEESKYILDKFSRKFGEPMDDIGATSFNSMLGDLFASVYSASSWVEDLQGIILNKEKRNE